MVRTRGIVASLVVVALAVSACSGGSGGGAGSSGVPFSSGAPNVSLGVPDMPAGGNGSCSVSLTGDVTNSWKINQNMGSLLVSYWLSANDRSMLSIKDTDAYFIMNCHGDSGSVSFTLSNGTSTAQFPMAPAKYAIAAGGILSGGSPGQVQIIVDLKDANVWRTAEGGSFEITTFGGRKFAGTFQAKLEKMADNLRDVAGTATLAGSFDLSCTGSACS